jgi:hypothetical protein
MAVARQNAADLHPCRKLTFEKEMVITNVCTDYSADLRYGFEE